MEKKYWKGVEELRNEPEFVRLRDNEFFENLPLDEVISNKASSAASSTRRDFLKFLGFSVAAASLAACEAPVSLGTDTGGSVRAPSAHNALVGLRPTVGVVSRTGMVPLNSVRDTPGPMARTVTDMAVLLDVLAGPDPQDPVTTGAGVRRSQRYTAALNKDALKGARLGVLRQVFRPAVTDARIVAHFETTLAELKAAGAEIVDMFVVPDIDSIPRPPNTAARFKDERNAGL